MGVLPCERCMNARRLAFSVCFSIALIKIFRRAFPPVSHEISPPDQKYIHTYIHTNKQTNKHRKRKTSRWLRPYVFNIGLNIGQKPTLSYKSAIIKQLKHLIKLKHKHIEQYTTINKTVLEL